MLYSRKVLSLLFGLAATLIGYYAKLPMPILTAIMAVFVAVAGGLALEDFGRNMGGATPDRRAEFKAIVLALLKYRQFQYAISRLIITLLGYYTGWPSDMIQQFAGAAVVIIFGSSLEKTGSSLAK